MCATLRVTETLGRNESESRGIPLITGIDMVLEFLLIFSVQHTNQIVTKNY